MRPYLFENNRGKEWVRKFAATGKAKILTYPLPIPYLYKRKRLENGLNKGPYPTFWH
jgi:hypothetical protein